MNELTRVLPVGARPRSRSLLRLTLAWAKRETGTVRTPGVPDVHLLSGEGTSPADPDYLAAAICEEGLGFRPGEVEHDGTTVELGGLMIEAARLLSCPRTIMRNPRLRVAQGPLYNRVIHRVPLPSATRAVLGHVLKTGLSLHEALRMEGMGPGIVADDLAALAALELIVISPMHPGSLPQEGESLRMRTLPPGELVETNEALLRRLEREWAMVRDVDDWTALGLRPGSSGPRVEAAARRLTARYRGVLEEPELPPEVKHVAEKLYRHAQRAGRRIASGVPPDAPTLSSGAAQTLRDGWTALRGGDLAEARRLFGLARRDPRGTAAGLAGEGWADVIDDASTEVQRQAGLELLELAASLAPGDSEIITLFRSARTQLGLRATVPDE